MDILSLAATDIRGALRSLSRRRRAFHPLLYADLVTQALGELEYPDTLEHRWWALGGTIDRIIIEQIGKLPNFGSVASDPAPLPKTRADRARHLLALARAGARGELSAWVALYCQYVAGRVEGTDFADVVGVHKRTWQRWLGLGHLILREHLHELECQVGTSSKYFSQIHTKNERSSVVALPHVSGRLIGRQGEVDRINLLLQRDDVWLVTLTGPGGVGKTHLSVAVAAAIAAPSGAGVVFVDLSDLADPHHVIPTIGRALGAIASDRPSMARSLAAVVSGRWRLLVLDGLDHVVPAGRALAELATLCPEVKMLITSREALHLHGEQVVAVAPLDVPAPADVALAASPADVAGLVERFPALQLFADRARFARHDFVLTADNVPAVAEVCRRLDGLPLAIELAARYAGIFTPQVLATMLDRTMKLLVDGPSDRPERHRSLYANIAWTTELLNDAEQMACRRLAVFVGGFTPEAAVAVCGAAGGMGCPDILTILRALARKSLIQPMPGMSDEPRFGMLTTMRDFGLISLAAAGEIDVSRQAHAEVFAQLAARAAEATSGADHAALLDRLDLEHTNLQAALKWCFDGAAQELGARMAADLRDYWFFRGRLHEGAHWSARIMDLQILDDRLRTRALNTAGYFLTIIGRIAEARTAHEACLATATELGDPGLLALAHGGVGAWAVSASDHPLAQLHFDQSLAAYREVGDAVRVARVLYNLAVLARHQEDVAAVSAKADEALVAFTALGDQSGVARCIVFLAWVALRSSDLDTADHLLKRVRAIAGELDDLILRAQVDMDMAFLAYVRGRVRSAVELWRSSLAAGRAANWFVGIAAILAHVAAATAAPVTDLAIDPPPVTGEAPAVPRQRLETATRLLAAAHVLRSDTDLDMVEDERRRLDHNTHALRDALGVPGFAGHWALGKDLSVDEACAEALAAAEGLAESAQDGR